MRSKCEYCSCFRRSNLLKFICPLEDNQIGLEKNIYCRQKTLTILNTLSIKAVRLCFSNNRIKKSYNESIILSYEKLLDFFNSKKFFLFYKYFLKIKKDEITRILFEPAEFLFENETFRKKILERELYGAPIKILREIALYLEMGYEFDKVYERVFEPDITLDEDWYVTTDKVHEIKPLLFSTIKLIKKGENYLYIVNVENERINKSTLKFHKLRLIEDVAGLSNNLRRFFTLLEDTDIQEIYLDKENSWVYIDHVKFGRCDTNVFLTSTDVEKLKTAISIISGEEINLSNPSVKLNILDENINLRIAIDVFPIVTDTAIDVRKFNKKMLNMHDLIKLNSIEPKVAAFLIYSARNRFSIAICGEPNSGKTTLAYAISEHLPNYWRKVFIEDVEEVYAFIKKEKSLFIKASSIDVSDKYSTKSKEIVKMLHRSPDWIFFREIQTKEHSQAVFHALLAGLKGIMTCHAASVQELINRWIIQHNIHPSCIPSLDLIVYMERSFDNNKILRKLKCIYEINWNKDKDNTELIKIYDINNLSLENGILQSNKINDKLKFNKLRDDIDIIYNNLMVS